MKKHRGAKITVIISFILIICGSLLLGAGVVQGGSLRYLSVNSNTVSWWPFGFGNIGVGFFDEAFDDDFMDSSNSGTSEKQLGDVKSFSIDADVADIEIHRGTTNKIRYRVRSNQNISIDENSGNVSVALKHKRGINHNNGSIYVELKDEIYDKIKVDCAVGEISINGTKTKELIVKADLGNIELEDIYSEETKVDEKCGEINIDGVLLGRSEISNKLGSTDVNIKGNPSEYRYEVKNSLGSTQIMDSDHDGKADVAGGNSSAKNFISIKNSLGDIELEFN
ncbi:MAG: DUF4097 family beta strand repeat-containing protein [Longicatena sp.]